jgi:hypothetical protein
VQFGHFAGVFGASFVENVVGNFVEWLAHRERVTLPVAGMSPWDLTPGRKRGNERDESTTDPGQAPAAGGIGGGRTH